MLATSRTFSWSTGNNEFVGPYGPGTVFHDFSSSRTWIRADIALRTTKISQLMGDAIGAIFKPASSWNEWSGMEMFLDNRVPPQDPRAAPVYEHLRDNLSDLCSVAHRAQAKVILCTVLTNLKDCAPFASCHREGLGAGELAQWEECYRSGVTHAEAGRSAQAIEALVAASRIDDQFADLHFRLGRAYLALGQRGPAEEHLRRARDLDALRFRADTQVNTVIRQVAAGRQKEGVLLHDVEKAFAGPPEDAQAIPGRQWFYEHVHFRPEGNYRLAKEVFGRVASLLAQDIRPRRPDELPSMDRCAELLALTASDRYRMQEVMRKTQELPPFTNQCDHKTERQRRENESETLWAEATLPSAIEDCLRCYRAAVERTPDDVQIRMKYASLLQERGLGAAAAEQVRLAIDRFPDVAPWYEALGGARLSEGKWQDAVAAYQQAARCNPACEAREHLNIGRVMLRQNELASAEAELRRALSINPKLAEAIRMLGACRSQQGRITEAIECFRRALEIAPDQGATHEDLASALASQNRWDEAVHEFRQAVRIDPRNFSSYRELSLALGKQGRLDEMVEVSEQAVRALPNFPEAHVHLGSLLQSRGRMQAAEAEYRAALLLEPTNVPASINLAGALDMQGRTNDAIALYRGVLLNHPDIFQALNNLARLLATCLPRQYRNGAEAVRLAKRACELTGGQDPIPLDTLGAAYAETGQFEAALQAENTALELARRQNAKDLIPAMEHRLLLLRARIKDGAADPQTKP